VTYEVVIDRTLAPGSLTYGECLSPLPRKSEDELVLTTHVCHASLANDNVPASPCSRRRLYWSVSGANPGAKQRAILSVLDQSDGSNTLLDIAGGSGLAFADLRRAADALLEAGLLAEAQ
jgi:aminopeptidase-like protein